MKKIFKFLMFLIILAGLAIGGYWVYLKYFTSQETTDAFYLIPQKTFMVMETRNISEAWTELSSTPLWQQLIKTEYFEEWNEDLEYVDALLDSNKVANYLLGDKKVIMALVLDQKDWDFLYIVDLSSAAKTLNDFNKLLGFIDGYDVRTSEFSFKGKKYDIIELIDLEFPDDILYMSVVNNILLVSYTKTIVTQAIKDKDIGYWANDPAFKKAFDENPESRLFKIFINYKFLDDFANYYLTAEDETMQMLANSLNFSALDLNVKDDKIVMEGFTNADTSTEYLRALMNVEPARMESYKIMTNQTAAFVSICFKDYKQFYQNLMAEYTHTNPDYAENINKGINLLKKTFNIDIERDFIDWIGNEIAIYKIRPATTASRAEDIALVIKANDIEAAKNGLTNITEKIRKITPFKFKETEYKNFTINYFHQKKFFNLFLGNMFADIEKPYYTFIEDYVVFTNSLDLLKQIIDDYINGRTIEKNEAFQDFIDNFSIKNTFSIFVQMPKMYPTLLYFTPYQDRKDIEENKDLITSFSYFGFQLVTDRNGFDTRVITKYDPEAPIDDLVEQMAQETENNLFTEFIDTMGYKIILTANEKIDGPFEEYYDTDGTKPKIEGKIENKKMTGIWRTYYPDGKLKSVINYEDDKVDGTGYFYYDNPTNTLHAEINFASDLPQGIYKEYYDNGAQKALLNYEAGKLEGEAEFYYKTGRLKIKGKYKNGQKHGKWTYYNEDGNIIKKEKWKNGVLKKQKEF